jgi:hypothetical protein
MKLVNLEDLRRLGWAITHKLLSLVVALHFAAAGCDESTEQGH